MLSPLWNESTKEYSTANLMFKVKSKSRLAQVSALNPDHQQDICLEVCPASALLYLWFMKSAKSGIRLKSVICEHSSHARSIICELQLTYGPPHTYFPVTRTTLKCKVATIVNLEPAYEGTDY